MHQKVRTRRQHRLKEAFIILLMLSLLLGGCRGDEEVRQAPELLEPTTTQTGTIQVERRELLAVEYMDVMAVPVSEKLYLTMGGLIQQVEVGVGDRVEEGQVLLVLDQSSLEETIANSQEQYDSLATQYAYSESAASYAISAATYRQAKAGEDKTKAEENLKKAEEDKTAAEKALEDAKKAESERLAAAATKASEAEALVQEIQTKEDALAADVATAEAALNTVKNKQAAAEASKKEAEATLKEQNEALPKAEKALEDALAALNAAEEAANSTEEETSTEESPGESSTDQASSDVANAAQKAEEAVEAAQAAVDEIKAAIALAELTISSAESTIEDCKAALPEAQLNYDLAVRVQELGLEELQVQRDLAAKEKETREAADEAAKAKAEEAIAALEEAVASADKIIETEKTNIENTAYAIDSAALEVKEAKLNLSQLQEDHWQRLSQFSQEIELMQAELGKNVLKAPYPGRIIEVDFYEGQYLNEYETCIIIADESKLLMEGPAYNNTAIQGFIRMDLMVDGRTLPIRYVPYDNDEYLKRSLSGETLPTWFELPEDPDGSANGLSYGMSGTVRLYRGYKESTLVVPRGCVSSDEYGAYVYLDKDGQRVKTYVITGLETTSYYEILEGLEEGEVLYDAE